MIIFYIAVSDTAVRSHSDQKEHQEKHTCRNKSVYHHSNRIHPAEQEIQERTSCKHRRRTKHDLIRYPAAQGIRISRRRKERPQQQQPQQIGQVCAHTQYQQKSRSQNRPHQLAEAPPATFFGQMVLVLFSFLRCRLPQGSILLRIRNDPFHL